MAVAFLASALKQPNGSPLTQITNLRYAVNEAIPPVANPCGFYRPQCQESKILQISPYNEEGEINFMLGNYESSRAQHTTNIMIIVGLLNTAQTESEGIAQTK